MFKKKLRVVFAAVVLAVSISGLAFAKNTVKDNTATKVLHPLGCILDSKERIASFPKGSEIYPDSTVIPSSVDLTSYFPTPGNQGRQNSCTAWATAYADKTSLAKVKYNWNVNTSNHEFSPAYVYNQINGGQDSGSAISDAMNLLVNKGDCSLKDMSYDESDYTTQPNAQQKTIAASYKSSKWYVVNSVTSMKNNISNYDTVVVGIPVYPDFDNISTSNPVYDIINNSDTSRGNHAICFIGYDDSIVCADGTKGAFKLINSWSTAWGIRGYGYMSYSLVTQLALTGYVLN